MPTYTYTCKRFDCTIPGNERDYERNVPITERDEQICTYCECKLFRKLTFTGLTWAPTAGGMR